MLFFAAHASNSPDRARPSGRRGTSRSTWSTRHSVCPKRSCLAGFIHSDAVILPRQAEDKHTETALNNKQKRFLAGVDRHRDDIVQVSEWLPNIGSFRDAEDAEEHPNDAEFLDPSGAKNASS
jgi:hypothetical protein